MGPYLPNYSPSYNREYGNFPSTSTSSPASSLGSVPPLSPSDIRVVRARPPVFSDVYHDDSTSDDDSIDHVSNDSSDQEPQTTQMNVSDQTNGEQPSSPSAMLQAEPEPESALQPGLALQWAVLQALINVGIAARERRRRPQNQADGLCRACQRSLALDNELDGSEHDDELAPESQREPRPSLEPAHEPGLEHEQEQEPHQSRSAASGHEIQQTPAPVPQHQPQHQIESDPPARQRHSKISNLLRRLLKKKAQTGTSSPPPTQQVPLQSQSQAQPPSPQLGPRGGSYGKVTLRSKIRGTIRKLLPFKKKQKPQESFALPPPMLTPGIAPELATELELGEPRVVNAAERELEHRGFG